MCAVKIKGLDKVVSQLKNLSADTDKILQAELKAICDEILAEAIARVPVDTGKLKGSAYINKTENGWAIGFSVYYAPYVEFGTGGYVVIPKGYEDFAWQFKGATDGFSRPRAYLFPAYLERRDNIVNELEQKINAYLKSK